MHGNANCHRRNELSRGGTGGSTDNHIFSARVAGYFRSDGGGSLSLEWCDADQPAGDSDPIAISLSNGNFVAHWRDDRLWYCGISHGT